MASSASTTAAGSLSSTSHLSWSSEHKRARPFKFEGYPAFCRYIARDNDMFLIRRFGALNARVLLNMQNIIEIEEEKLEKLDEECANDPDEKALLSSLEYDRDNALDRYRKRGEILENLQQLLFEYNEYIATYSQLRDRESAQEYQVTSLKNWLWNRSTEGKPDSGPISDVEQQYLYTGKDLICITSGQKSPLVRIVDSWPLIRRMFRKQASNSEPVDSSTVYWSKKKVEWFCNVLIVGLGLCMLYGPMWWLNFVYDDVKRLVIITVFVFLFAIGLSLVGSGKPFETLAATAAYAAVLMVFMQRQEPGGKDS